MFVKKTLWLKIHLFPLSWFVSSIDKRCKSEENVLSFKKQNAFIDLVSIPLSEAEEKEQSQPLHNNPEQYPACLGNRLFSYAPLILLKFFVCKKLKQSRPNVTRQQNQGTVRKQSNQPTLP